MGDEGAKCIAEALKINQSLKQLNLSRNNIGAIGAIALSEALKINQSLKNLDLSVSHKGIIVTENTHFSNSHFSRAPMEKKEPVHWQKQLKSINH